MLRSLILSILLAGSCFAADVSFPELKDIKEPVLFPKGAKVTIDRHGNYCVNGRPRFLMGAQIPNKIVGSMAPTKGYPDSLKWLYEQVIDYETAQRVGLDTISYFASESWLTQIDPNYKSFLFDQATRDALTKVRRDCGLPLQVDFTAAPWSHGMLQANRAQYQEKLPETVFNSMGVMGDSNHWVPYCLADQAGREMYLKMWRSGAEELKASGGQALMYELFNEPAYHDPCPANRKNFIAFLKSRYGSLEKVNLTWNTAYKSFEDIENFKSRTDSPALFVEWSKFMEDEFLKLCLDGMKVIREIDPEARFCIQCMGADNYRTLPKNHINLYEINQYCTTVSTSTGGGVKINQSAQLQPSPTVIDTPMPDAAFRENALQRRFYRAIANGKPIHDGETYSGADYDSLHSILWLQLVRGGNASYLFLWCKRAWDNRWQPHGSEEGGKRLAELMRFHILNPWAFPTEGLKAIMDVKKEMLQVDDLFVPRENYTAPEIGLLLSYPTERRAPAVGNMLKNEIRNIAISLELTHYPYGVLLEEQTDRFDPVKFPVIIAGAVRSIYPVTRDRVLDYVKKGGTLITSLETMPENEYGQPIDWQGIFDLKLTPVKNPALTELDGQIAANKRLPGKIKVRRFADIDASSNWETLASAEGKPAVVRRKVGSGQVIFIGVQSMDYHHAAIYDSLLNLAGRKPVVSLMTDNQLVPNVEIHHIQKGTLAGFYALNLDRYPKFANLELPAGHTAVDPLSETILPDATIYLPPQRSALIVTGTPAELGKRFKNLRPISRDELQEKFNAAVAKIKQSQQPQQAEFRYNPDLRLTKIIDLRDFCNRPFTDSVAGDGKGGWTDQGAENSLNGVPWGIQEFRGVPTEILRFDETENKTCIVLNSKNLVPGFGAETVKDIPINAQVKNLYFFHATAWSVMGKEAMFYRICYADGSELKIPVICGINIGEWWIPRRAINAKLTDHVAFVNSEQRGFFVWRWENPQPEKEIRSLDIISANAEPIPVVIGITAEFHNPDSRSLAGWRAGGWFGCQAKWNGDKLAVTLAENKKDWCGFSISAPKDKMLDVSKIDLKNSFLVFKINGANDAWGRHTGGQNIQVYMSTVNADGKKISSSKISLGAYLDGKVIDDDPTTWQEIKISLNKFFPKTQPEQIATVTFQFTGIAPAAGVEIGGLYLECR